MRWWKRTKRLGGWSVDKTRLLFHLLVIVNYIIIHCVFVPNFKLTPLRMVACLDLSMESISSLTYCYYRQSSNKFGLCNLVNYLLNCFHWCSLGICCLPSLFFLASLNLNFYISFVTTLLMGFLVGHLDNVQMWQHVTKSKSSFPCVHLTCRWSKDNRLHILISSSMKSFEMGASCSGLNVGWIMSTTWGVFSTWHSSLTTWGLSR